MGEFVAARRLTNSIYGEPPAAIPLPVTAEVSHAVGHVAVSIAICNIGFSLCIVSAVVAPVSVRRWHSRVTVALFRISRGLSHQH